MSHPPAKKESAPPTAPESAIGVTEDAAEAATPSPEAAVEELHAALAAKEEEAKANYDRFLRERAELENFRRRMQREKADALRFAVEPLVRELLPVVDNLERALAQEPGNEPALREGVRLVLESLHAVLAQHGVTTIDAVGEPFDPARHEAIARIETDAHEPNRVVDQLHRGYHLHDRLLRPALVTVSARTAEETKK